MRRRAFTSLALVLGVAAARDARADEALTEREPVVELRHDLRVDIPATGALAVVTVAWRLTRDDLEPSHCRWCDGDAPGHVNAVDDWFRSALRRPDVQPANVTSYILAFGVAPVSAATLSVLAATNDHRGGEALADVFIVAEGGFSAMLATELLEPLALRTRPYVHAIADDQARAAEIAKTGAFHSFPAGHVVETFGVAAASGTVASMRGYRLAPLVWAAGMILGVATAYTRLAADRHYFTDVLAGAAIGTAIGVGVPLLFHPATRSSETATRARPSLAVGPVAGGQMVTLGWLF